MIKVNKDDITKSAARAATGPWPQEPMAQPLVMETGTMAGFPQAEINQNFNCPPPPQFPPKSPHWELADGWEQKVLDLLRQAVEQSRTLRLFMENCQHCGACADKCPFYIGTGDSLNMPVLRAELLRAVWKRHFTLAGRIMAKMAGATELTPEVLRKWWYYFFQCSACRRCAVFCPLGIDTAEFTNLGREILWRLGLSTDWATTPAWNSYMTGNHLGLKPAAIMENVEFILSDLKEATGLNIAPRINKKGAEFLFIFPSADIYSEPGIFTFMGYILLFEHLKLDYTISAFAAEAGNFGAYLSPEITKRLTAKFYQEAERLKVKWLMAGECGIMTRIMGQYLGTMWPAPARLETPVSPATGTVFKASASTKMIHVLEMAADAAIHGKLKLDPSRNDHLRVTLHDSCNTARGLGLIEEPRLVLKSAVNHFFEMSKETIKEKTLCCGGGGGLNGGAYIKTRMMGGYARAQEVLKVAANHGVNTLACHCAVDRATLPPLMEFWAPDVSVYGLSELLGNALIMEGQNDRPTDLRGNELPGAEADKSV